MSEPKPTSRRDFLRGSLAAAGALGVMAGARGSAVAAAPAKPAAEGAIPCGQIGKAKISRLMVGGNLISGCMHSRDLLYVNQLFRAYVNDERILATLKLAEENGVNTVFETGAQYVQRYNRECGGHMQFIPHIEVGVDQKEGDLEDHIQRQVDSGAVALYVWGVAADALVKGGHIERLARAVDLAKAHSLPVGVGGHSLQVPMACEKHKVPCDFYVKTFHTDDYPSATPKELRQEWMWITGGKGWYDNMWCINPEETADFMKSVAKPWIAFKVLAAGGIPPAKGFAHAFNHGADFIAVGMFDFQVKEDADLARKAIAAAQKRPRPWRA